MFEGRDFAYFEAARVSDEETSSGESRTRNGDWRLPCHLAPISRFSQLTCGVPPLRKERGVFAVVATSRAWPPSFNLNDPLLPEPGNRGANRARQWTNCGGRRVEAAAV